VTGVQTCALPIWYVVFKEDGRGGWYDAVAALRGVIEFHQLAEARHGHPANVEALIRFANKLESSAPIFEHEITMVRACIASCIRQALKLRISQSTDILDTLRIKWEMEKIREAA
jgi:fructose-bisphosphate aldolase class 1